MQIKRDYFYFLLFIVLLLPALINGFPLYYYNDSWEYLANANGNLYSSRSVYYGLLLSPFFQLLKLIGFQAWAAPLINSFFFSLTIYISFTSELRGSLIKKGLLLFLVVFSYLPIYASYILPDIYLACGFFALYALATRDHVNKERIILHTLIFISIIVHIGNLSLFFVTSLLTALVYRKFRKELKYIFVNIALSYAVLIAPNLYFYKRAVLSPISALWPLSSLSETGLLEKVLTKKCSEDHHYSKMCAHLDKRIYFMTDMMIWDHENNSAHSAYTDGTFSFPSKNYWNQLGAGAAEEVSMLYWDALAHFPFEVVTVFSKRVWEQVVDAQRTAPEANLHDLGLDQNQSESQFVEIIGKRGLEQFRGSLEYRTLFLGTTFYNLIHYLSYLFLLLAFGVMIFYRRLFEVRDSFFVVVFVGLVYIQSGLFAVPDDRLFYRAVWLVPFFLALKLPRRGKLRL